MIWKISGVLTVSKIKQATPYKYFYCHQIYIPELKTNSISQINIFKIYPKIPKGGTCRIVIAAFQKEEKKKKKQKIAQWFNIQ